MPTLQETAEALGLSYKQAFRRLSAVRHLIPEHIKRGENGALILDGGAVEVLRRLEAFRKEGRTLREAAGLIAEELRGNGAGNPGEALETTPPGNGEVAALRELIMELRARVTSLEADKTYLQERLTQALNQLEELQRLALPRPRTPWWARLVLWRQRVKQ